MDRLGIDVQVMIHTLWTVRVTDGPEVELGLCKSWNRWVAEMWRLSSGRLRWCAVPPLMSMDESVKSLEWAKEHGAVGVSLPPIIGKKLLIDPYFHPLYREAERLDMVIAVHIGNGNEEIVALTQPAYDTDSFGLMRFRLVTAGACEGLIESRLPLKFPKLRWAFIEAGSMWLPWMIHEAKRRMVQRRTPLPDDVLKAFNIFVTCQNNDELTYTYPLGPDNIVIGSDYGHYDGSSQMDATLIMRQRTDIDEQVKRKILCEKEKLLWVLYLLPVKTDATTVDGYQSARFTFFDVAFLVCINSLLSAGEFFEKTALFKLLHQTRIDEIFRLCRRRFGSSAG